VEGWSQPYNPPPLGGRQTPQDVKKERSLLSYNDDIEILKDPQAIQKVAYALLSSELTDEQDERFHFGKHIAFWGVRRGCGRRCSNPPHSNRHPSPWSMSVSPKKMLDFSGRPWRQEICLVNRGEDLARNTHPFLHVRRHHQAALGHLRAYQGT